MYKNEQKKRPNMFEGLIDAFFREIAKE